MVDSMVFESTFPAVVLFYFVFYLNLGAMKNLFFGFDPDDDEDFDFDEDDDFDFDGDDADDDDW